jgi:hypothetical protein
MGMDQPGPDHANADLILVISAHLESGHCFGWLARRAELAPVSVVGWGSLLRDALVAEAEDLGPPAATPLHRAAEHRASRAESSAGTWSRLARDAREVLVDAG